MHPDALKTLMLQAIEGKLSPDDERELETLLAREPRLVAELERLALQRVEGACDGAIDDILVSERDTWLDALPDTARLETSILGRTTARTKGRLLRLPHIAIGIGAAAAGVALLLVLNPFGGADAPPADRGRSAALSSAADLPASVLQLGDGYVGFRTDEHFKLQSGISVQAYAGCLLRIEDGMVAVLGGKAEFSSDGTDTRQVAIGGDELLLNDALVRIECTERRLLPDERELTSAFRAWIAEHEDVAYQALALSGTASLERGDGVIVALKIGEAVEGGEALHSTGSKAEQRIRLNAEREFLSYKTRGAAINVSTHPDVKGYDADFDGNVTQNEFVAGKLADAAKASEKEIATDFERLDADRDGQLGVDEVGNRNSALWSADADGDHILTRDELMRALRDKPHHQAAKMRNALRKRASETTPGPFANAPKRDENGNSKTGRNGRHE